MTRTEYYESLKQLARQKRQHLGISTECLGIREIRRIYRTEGVRLDLWPRGKTKLKRLRGAYFPNDGNPCVLINRQLPEEPRIFTMLHELKHHWTDQNLLRENSLLCMEYDPGSIIPEIEIGAEVFAAEFLFPEAEFRAWAAELLPDGRCTPEDVVRLKHLCPAKVSYTFLRKRLEWLRFANKGSLPVDGYKSLERRMFGTPFYARLGSQRTRVTKSA